MNKNIKIALGVLTVCSLASCSVHDQFDELAAIGRVAPNVFWEFPSSEAKAGDSVAFTAQYYMKDAPVDRIEVWYSTTEKITMKVTCPLVTTFTYSVGTDTTILSRQMMKSIAYAHQEKNWDKDRSAYVLTDKFPTSRTLRLTEWKEVQKFDQEKFDMLFPKMFIENFRTNLYPKLKAADLRKMMVQTKQMDSKEFRACTDYTIDANSLDTIWTIKPEKVGLMKENFDKIKFEDLIYDSPKQTYQVEYSKSYELAVRFEVFSKEGIVGITDDKIVTLK
ncbi:MAG: hypothetical protein RSA44_06140 [Bacteroides sp.]